MVDIGGAKPVTTGERIGRVQRPTPARPPEAPVRTEPRAPAPGLRQVAQELAASPPVDADRVSRIRRAIAEGRFPMSPATIADRLIALKLNWTGNDQA